MHFLKRLSISTTLVAMISLVTLVFPNSIHSESKSKSPEALSISIGEKSVRYIPNNNQSLPRLLSASGSVEAAMTNTTSVIVNPTTSSIHSSTTSLKAGEVGRYTAKQTEAVTGISTSVETKTSAITSTTPAAANPITPGVQLLSNGNTAGEIGRYAAKQMEAATGVPAATWEYIIARESNGQVDVQNPSGASGLFQTMPGWGSTATVEDQIQSALNAYNAQGLSAWGY